MTFISYAQNFEDVMLWRALKNIEKGFYIDVGANDPTIDSVTKAFYERGWSGINIEPLLLHHLDLQNERLRDINLQCAAGSVHGEIELWESDVRGWATADKLVVALYTENGHEGVIHKVPMLSLTEICTAYVKSEIHFLKIDIEGFEKSVIEGMDFSRFRPWILVIEATRPNSTEEVYDEWEGQILSANYLLAYTDGLNRFYVANEHCELLLSLRYPPNVFDGFIRSEQLNSELRAQQAEAKAQQAETELCAILNSSSWRLSAPLRMVGHNVKSALSLLKAAKLNAKAKIKLLPVHAKLYVARRPKLSKIALAVLNQFPALKNRIRQATLAASSAQIAHPPVATELASLTPRARRIYTDLKAALEQQQKEHS